MRRWLIVVAGLAVLAGCSASSSHDAGSNAGGGGDAGGGVAGTAAPSRSTHATTPLQHRDVVRTASMTVVTAHIDRAADAAVRLAVAAGGRVDGDDRTHTGRLRTARLVLRVPPSRLDRVIAGVDGQGHERSRSERGTDQTAGKADIDGRAAALRTSVTRLQGFMSHAGSLSDLTTLEQNLTDRQAQLASLLTQQSALADQIDLASLTVSVVPPVAPAPRAEPTRPAGFAAAFVTGGHGIAVAVLWLLALLGYVLPAALLAGLAVALVVLTRRAVPWRR